MCESRCTRTSTRMRVCVQSVLSKKSPSLTFCGISYIHSLITLILQNMAEAKPVNTTKPQWKLQQRMYGVKHYYMTGSLKKIEETFMHQFECEKVHFDKYGAMEKLNVASENRPCKSGCLSKRTAEQIKTVRELVQQSPKVQNHPCSRKSTSRYIGYK